MKQNTSTSSVLAKLTKLRTHTLKKTADARNRISGLLTNFTNAGTSLILFAQPIANNDLTLKRQAFMRFQCRNKKRAACITTISLSLRYSILCRFISPDRPPFARITRKHLKERHWRASFNEVILLIRFTRMLTLTRLNHVDLTTSWGKRAHRTAHTKEDKFRHITEVETNSPAIRPTILTTLRSHQV